MEKLISNSEKEKTSGLNTIPDFSFSDLVDISDLQQLVNHLSELAGCPIGILDVDNTILASAGWQKICTGFHRIHPGTRKHCAESDCYIRQNLETESPIAYKCKNGLYDVAYPVIIEGKHLANIFFGQFFYDDEKIDIHYFELQAEKYGFNKTEYLKALSEVPVISRKKEDLLKNFSITLAKMLTKTGYSNLVLKKEKIEELRIANEQIKESELKFRKLFEHAGVGVVQIDSSTGRFVQINKKFAETLGYSIEELLQMDFQSVTHPDDLKESLRLKNQLFKKQNSEFSTEKRYIRKNGTIVWAITTVSKMTEITGGDKNHIVTVQDITERKKSEQALLESELKYRKLFEQAGVGVVQIEASTGRLLKVNKKFADMLGYSIDELLQLTFFEFTHPDELEENLIQQKLFINKEISEFTAERRHIRKDGTVAWVMLTVNSVSDYQLGIVQDITERKKAEQEVLESELKFRKVFEQAGVGVVQIESATGKFLRINKKFADMLGYGIDELVQLSFKSITHPDDLEKNLDQMNQLIKKQINEFSIEKRFIRKDGTILWTILTVTGMSEVVGGTMANIGIAQDITDRKKSEQDLKESELKFRTLFEQAGVGVAQIESSTGRFVKINKKYAEMLGYTVDEMMQLTFRDFTHPDDLKESLHYKERLINKKNAEFSLDKRYIRKDGAIVWVRLTTTAMWEIEEGTKFHISVVKDITDGKNAIQDLLESEEKFKSMFYQSPIGLELYDIDGKLVDCNPANLSILGIDNLNDVIGFNLFENPNLSEQQKRDIKEGKNVQFEIKLDFDTEKKFNLHNTRKYGTCFLSCLATPFKIKGNNKTGFLLHLLDITENKKAEGLLKEENERFQTTMNAIDSVVYVADLENHEILFVNKYVKDLFGDITGKKCYSALQGKTAPCDFCSNHLLLDGNGKVKQPYIWEFQNLITKRWYQCHDQAIQWTNGNLVRFEIATDITKNKENEQALKENEIKLQELNTTKDKFFSIIAHDLKNPFAVLINSSELLSRYLEKNDLPKSKAKTAMISNASKHGYGLLENLLVWAKSQTGGLKFDPRKLNFKNSVSETMREVEDHAIEKNITITNEIPEDLILEADENLLSVVFRNLITNAIKFTHNGGSIIITAKIDNYNVEVAVIDTGIGIPKEHQHKLFRLDANFSRAGTANESSTSLGLILCKEFIEKHKGKIWVESEVNKGSEFRFTLPNIQVENNSLRAS